MLSSALIVFREVLEAALVVTIVLAATKGVVGRGGWVAGGIGLGVAGAIIVAIFAEAIATAASGMGQEFFNAAVLFAAVVMLGWHNVWMERHGRELAQHMLQVGREVSIGNRPLYVLLIVVGLAVLREGAEVVLFLYGIAASGSQANTMLVGGLLGLGLGSLVGVLLYWGLLRLSTKYLFVVTSWLILLLAAGMAAQGAGFLVQAGVLPELGGVLWDISGWLSEQSIPGEILHTLIGYEDNPMGIQLLFYIMTILIIGIMMKTKKPIPNKS